MDRRCVWNWLNDVYRNPKVAFNTYSDDQQIEFAHDALALLKEQKSEEKRILKIVWDILHSGVSTDTEADQDWLYEQIRNQVHRVY